MAHIVAFLARERDLINTTAICQHWRTILLSFPRLWCNAGGSSSEIQAYIERSKSTPIDVNLSSLELAELIVPHTSRLTGLTVRLADNYSFSQIEKYLRHPIPTLHTFRISAVSQLHTLEFPPSLYGHFCLHSKKLEIRGISAFRGPQTFPHVTELTLHTNANLSMSTDRLLGTLEQLPVLERVHITFLADVYTDPNPRVVTLPHLQEMNLYMARTGVHLPHILEYLRLPELTSLCVQAMSRLITFRPVFPVTAFDERLPNFAKLPELQVDMSSGEITFQSPSQASLRYLTRPLANYDSHERIFWKELPLHSVRRLTVNLALPPTRQELEWFIGLLRDLRFLEHLEFGGECGCAIQFLRYEVARKAISLRIQTLTVRCGEYARRRALWLKKCLFDTAGLNVTLICIPDPGVHEEGEAEMDTDSFSDGSDKNDGLG